MVANRAAAAERSAARKRARNRLIAAVIVLSCALGAMVGVTAYFWRSALAWEASSDAWEDQARRQGNDVAVLTAQLDGTAGRLSAMEGQLGTATSRISALADEKAQLGDENAIRQFFLEQQQANLDYQSRITAAATGATDALTNCTRSQDALIVALRANSSTDGSEIGAGESIEQIAAETDRLCADAVIAVETLRTILGDGTAETAITEPIPTSATAPSVEPIVSEDTTVLPDGFDPGTGDIWSDSPIAPTEAGQAG